jgi:hypothetical protein
MKKLFSYFAAALLLMAATAWAQEQPSGPSSNNPSDNATAGSTTPTPSDLEQLKAMVMAQQKQLEEQARQIQELKQQLEPRVVNATLSTSAAPRTVQPASDGATAVAQETEKPKTSPLSFRIGAAEFTPGGFVDFENIFRTVNTGNAASTNLGAFPFSNTVQGHLTEFKSTGQYSRLNLKTAAKFGRNDVTGYIEFDFNGNDAANVFVTSNGHTPRLRLYWLDLKRGKWEFLAGQTWGLTTPNRVGVSPNPADLSLGYQEDASIGVGYNYTRAAEFRAAYHFNDHWVWAVAAQNPDQFVGAGETLFPFQFNAQLGVQFDAANQTATPNLMPDFITKIAFDRKFMGEHQFHFEVGGLETTVKATVLPTAPGSAFHSITNTGGGYFGDVLVDLWRGSEGRNIKFVASGMGGYGVGRYTGAALAPQTIVVPIGATGAFDARLSQVHAYDFVGGFEVLPHPKAQFAFLYGATYAQRNFFCDITSPSAGTCNGKPFGGFGGPNSPNSANRAIQEGTIDWTQTFWRNPQYGAVYLVMQASYLTRAPWFVPAGAPKNAHMVMGFLSVRYALP